MSRFGSYPLTSSNVNKAQLTAFGACYVVTVVIVLGFTTAFFIAFIIGGGSDNNMDHLNSITTLMSLADFDFSDDNNRSLSHSLNATFNVDMELRNDASTSGIRYENSTMFLRYKGMNIDMVPIGGAFVGSESSRYLNLTLKLMGHRLLAIDSFALTSSDDFSSDNGVLKLQTYVRFSGEGCFNSFPSFFSFSKFTAYPAAKSIHDLSIDVVGRSFTYRECSDYSKRRRRSSSYSGTCQSCDCYK